jgi:SAM-dependent methyltransferase
MNVVEAMLDLARVGPQDFVMDLGSGDGRIVIVAAKKYGARGVGVELDGALVSDARRAAQAEGVAGRVEFRAENLFTTDIERATVLTSYLFPRINLELRPRIFSQLKPGSRVVSHEFDFGNWKPDAKVTVPVPDKPYGPPRSEVFLWIVPANAAGRWQWRSTVDGTPLEIEVLLEQTFQELRGSATAAGRPARLQSARLRGEEIWLTLVADLNGRAVQHEFAGRIAGDRILGKARAPHGESGMEWQATRVTRGKINIDAASARPALAHELPKRGNS